jgi:hypothetical protein
MLSGLFSNHYVNSLKLYILNANVFFRMSAVI